MNKQRFVIGLLPFCLLACSSESLGPGSNANGGCPLELGNLTVENPNRIGGNDLCRVGGELTQSATIQALSDDLVWALDGDLTVKSGTLSIEAGAKIEANGADEYIYIENGASIQAVGTAANPIVMSSSDSDFDNGDDDWGGLIIESLKSASSENRIEYLVVAEAGENVTIGSADTYSASITFVGSHENTEVLNLQSHNAVSDGIALLGESADDVNKALLESILVSSASNDSVYFNDFSGLIKNLLVVQEVGSGRAGLRGGGVNSNPLLLSLTLIGNDAAASTSSSAKEVALLLDNDLELLRLANALFLDYANGCYLIEGGANVSGLDLDAIDLAPDPSFIDGVHCVDTLANVSGDFELRSSSNGFGSLQGLASPTADGLRFYETAAGVNFSSVSSATGQWYLESIVNNGSTFDNSSTDLKRYNEGDTDNDGNLPAVDTDDIATTPLLGFTTDPLYVGLAGSITFITGLGDSLPAGWLWLDQATLQPLFPQPGATAFVALPAQQIGTEFNLTVIGAIESETDTRFDDWTIEDSF